MSDLTAPLTPPDCDLRDFQYMPLDVVRLRDSDLTIQASGEEFRSAVMLWCASWHQVPAASLPDDPRTLASLAGFGRAVGEWEKHRDGALRGWVKCSDGRLYHPVVAEKANESWLAKHAHSYRKLLERLRKKGVKREEMPSFDQWNSAGMPKDWPPAPMEKNNSSAGKNVSSGGNATPFPRNDETAYFPSGDADANNIDQSDNKSEEKPISTGKAGVSSGNDEAFRRKDSEIPAENTLKVREHKGINNKTILSGKPDVDEVLAHLNSKTGRSYEPVKANLSLIAARLQDASVETCKAVIDAKVAEWSNDANMRKYLRPKTLFNATNFANYVGELGPASSASDAQKGPDAGRRDPRFAGAK